MRSYFGLIPTALFAVGSLTLRATADPITFTFSGNATGSLGGTDFTVSPFEFTLLTDTSGVFQPIPRFPNILNTQNAVLNFTLNGVMGTFNDPFHVFLNANGPRSSVGLSPESGDDLLDITAPSLAAYNLKTAFGPLTQTPPDFLNVGEAYATSAGDLIFTDDQNASIIFQARLSPAAVPESGVFALLLGTAAFGGRLLLLRHRSKSPRRI